MPVFQTNQNAVFRMGRPKWVQLTNDNTVFAFENRHEACLARTSGYMSIIAFLIIVAWNRMI